MTATTVERIAEQETSKKCARIVLAGGSGHVGTLLARHFEREGHDVTVLARTTFSAPWRLVAWDGEHPGPWVKQLDGADVLINLAGRSVNCRYNRWNRREILESRVRPTQALGVAIRSLKRPPALWLNASTATIYRHSLDRARDESGELGGEEKDAPPEWRFSIEVAKRWEEAFFSADVSRTRKVALRSAMIMSPDRGGVFDELSRLVRIGLGGKAGGGRQYVSWIHERDFVRAIEFLMEHDKISGIVNLASPNPLCNSDFMRLLREAWGKRFGVAANEWMLKVGACLLRTETELILKSRRVVPGRLLESGFLFDFPVWHAAAADLVRQWRERYR